MRNPPGPKGLHHVSVNVTDLEAALGFYVGHLGLRRRSDRPSLAVAGAWLDAGDQQVHLVEGIAPADLGQHFALLYDDLDATVRRLRNEGIDVPDPVPVGTARQTFVLDPFNNRVELHARS